jgi:hypothetical protein
MKERLTLSIREQKRLVVLNEVEKGKMVVRKAAEVLGISERQGWRLLAAYREEGAASKLGLVLFSLHAAFLHIITRRGVYKRGQSRNLGKSS